MDKRTFLEQAPTFYSVAVACAMIEGKREVFTLGQIKQAAPLLSSALMYDPLMEAALRLLVTAGVVEVIRIAFGPPVYRRLPTLDTNWLYSDACSQFPAFTTFAQIKNYSWLVAALADVNEHYQSLSIAPADFEEAIPSFWEPLPLDRGDDSLIKAAEAVEEATARIEADNGYSANVPGERDYVLQSLKTFSVTLRERAPRSRACKSRHLPSIL